MVVQKNTLFKSLWASYGTIIGKAHVAYIPKKRVVGLSKLQEWLSFFKKTSNTRKIDYANCEYINGSLDAKGVAVTQTLHINVWPREELKKNSNNSYKLLFRSI